MHLTLDMGPKDTGLPSLNKEIWHEYFSRGGEHLYLSLINIWGIYFESQGLNITSTSGVSPWNSSQPICLPSLKTNVFQ